MHTLIILIVGSGMIEHAIAKALARSEHDIKLYSIGKWINPGIEKLAITKIIDGSDNEKIIEYATEVYANIVIMDGNDTQLIERLSAMNIYCFLTHGKDLKGTNAPHNLLHKQDYNLKRLYTLANEYNHNYIIKTLNGDFQKTCQGNSAQELCKAHQTCKEMFATNDTIIIEKNILGIGFTTHFFIKNGLIIPTPSQRSYFQNDLNMGCSSFELENRDLQTVQKLIADYIPNVNNYNGILCGNFVKTNDNEIIIKDLQVGFNSPDIVILLELLKTDFVDILVSLRDSDIDFSNLDIQWSSEIAIATNIYSKEYPNVCGNACANIQIPYSQNIIYANVSQKGYKYQQLGKLLYVFWSKNKTLPATICRNQALLTLTDSNCYCKNDIGVI